MKKKMLAAAIASALAVPSAFAAIDDAGMKYTSASEGLYGSLRFALQSQDDNDANVNHESSRIGMQGDVDVGHGNTAFYRAEWRVRYDRDNDAPFATRLGYIGMRGAYGSVRFGQIWSAEYDYVFSLADVTNNVTGLISPTFRIKNALRYDSPDIQGFNFSLQAQALNQNGKVITPAVPSREFDFRDDDTRVDTDPNTALIQPLAPTDIMDIAGYNGLTRLQRAQFLRFRGLEEVREPTDATDRDQEVDPFIPEDTTLDADPLTDNPVTGLQTREIAEVRDPDDGNEFDRYVIAASYGIRGLNVAATYISDQDDDGSGADETDSKTWGIGGNYGQDNWKIGYVYRDTSDLFGEPGDDLTAHSFSGQVAFDKVTLRAVLETNELEHAGSASADSDVFTLEAQYSFSSKARAYVNYQNRDTEQGGLNAYLGEIVTSPTGTDEDIFYIAYRVDF